MMNEWQVPLVQLCDLPSAGARLLVCGNNALIVMTDCWSSGTMSVSNLLVPVILHASSAESKNSNDPSGSL